MQKKHSIHLPEGRVGESFVDAVGVENTEVEADSSDQGLILIFFSFNSLLSPHSTMPIWAPIYPDLADRDRSAAS